MILLIRLPYSLRDPGVVLEDNAQQKERPLRQTEGVHLQEAPLHTDETV